MGLEGGKNTKRTALEAETKPEACIRERHPSPFFSCREWSSEISQAAADRDRWGIQVAKPEGCFRTSEGILFFRGNKSPDLLKNLKSGVEFTTERAAAAPGLSVLQSHFARPTCSETRGLSTL